MTTPREVDDAIAALRGGEVVIVPTDTVYGLAAAADNAVAVEAMFRLKQRPVDTLIAALVSDVQQAERFVYLGPQGAVLASAFWPGPLTIVAPRHAMGSLAVGDDETLGVRCPDDAVCLALAEAVGPLAATSANLHGQPTPRTAPEVADLFPGVAAVIDDGPRPGSASTVVSVVASTPEVLRDGPISAAAVEAAVNR